MHKIIGTGNFTLLNERNLNNFFGPVIFITMRHFRIIINNVTIECKIVRYHFYYVVLRYKNKFSYL